MLNFLIAAFIASTFSLPFIAQTQQPALKPSSASDDKKPEQPVLLALEISYNPALPPAFLDVLGPTDKATWIWVTRFVPVDGWQLPTGSLPVKAVRLEPQFNGETTEVKVSVLQGRHHFEREELVDKYRLGVGDNRVLTKLKEFGVEPFRIAVTDEISPPPAPPIIDLRTGGVELAGVEVQSKPIPAYRIKFRNITAKNIRALSVRVVNGPSSLFQGNEGRPLLEPGAILEEYLPVVKAVQRGDSIVPGSSAVNTIVVSSTVFDDGTYDGDVEPACMMEAFIVGRTVWLRTVLSLLDQQIAEANQSVEFGAPQFRERLQQLKPQRTSREKVVSTVSPNCSSPSSMIEMTFNGQKLELLRQVEQIITTRPSPPIDFKTWLLTKKEGFKSWLALLEKA